ncbi:hypothetical protein TNCV_3259831 [Trichonephila clavipes]|nr:hypothetical protein TNCV_3259831 [Trichonephila clavipes]
MNILYAEYKKTKQTVNITQDSRYKNENISQEKHISYLRSQASALITFAGMIPYRMPVGDRLMNTFTTDFCFRIMDTFKKDFLCLDNEHIFGGDQGYTPEIMDEILTTARDLELEVNEDDIEELIMGHEDELTTEELQETQ